MADAATWAAIGVAGYAAVVSTYAAVVSTYHELGQRADRRRSLERGVRVEGQHRFRGAEDRLEPVHMVRVVNTKTRPVEILRVGVKKANGTGVWQPPAPPLPVRLEDGQSAEIELHAEWLLLQAQAVPSDIVGYAAEDSNHQVYESEHFSPPPSGSHD